MNLSLTADGNLRTAFHNKLFPLNDEDSTESHGQRFYKILNIIKEPVLSAYFVHSTCGIPWRTSHSLTHHSSLTQPCHYWRSALVDDKTHPQPHAIVYMDTTSTKKRVNNSYCGNKKPKHGGLILAYTERNKELWMHRKGNPRSKRNLGSQNFYDH